ncbi:response regulator transcription factor [Leucobacter denitrificans]|uniref:Response regulator transcription factor n=1 Tax=Leucobacter denitrificans TaxID=683042 RepID=A0A7G9S444_9MICO|nr:response regulator transcription factor [Leucobacter denitrificans]QNN62619.1 response regulator transcription factor [Leucobacter denitrificans]
MHAPPQVLRIGIVEDQPPFREMLQHLLGSVPGFRVRTASEVSETSGWNAEELDVALLDFELPDGTGLELGRQLRRANPGLGVVLLSAVDRASSLLETEDQERWSYLSKTSATSSADLVRTIRLAANGGSFIDPSVIARRTPRTGSPLTALSTRQYSVLTLVAEGLTNQAISERLGIALNSVNNHVNAMYSALGVNDKTHNPRVSAVRAFLQDSV